MNRMVIIGNGFDLAHGLQTRYEDFLIAYLKSVIESALKNGSSYEIEDELTKTSITYFYPPDEVYLLKSLSSVENLKDFVQLKKIKFLHHFVFSDKTFENANKQNNDESCIYIYVKSYFFNEILHNQNWTDIENLYYKKLISNFKKYKSVPQHQASIYQQRIKELNLSFQIVKDKLISYLQDVEENMSYQYKLLDFNFHYEDINDLFYKNHFSDSFAILPDKKIEKVLYLNFNYTSLVLDMIKHSRISNFLHIPIHGEIKNKKSIIFGYGDDSHNDYSLLENEDDFDLLKNMKAFYYPSQHHYTELMNFIHEKNFDIHILGHSLGLSDRVLLKTIFEHSNCKAIRLFHRGNEDSHFKKRIALSRHFSDKIKMRNKIVVYDENDKL